MTTLARLLSSSRFYTVVAVFAVLSFVSAPSASSSGQTSALGVSNGYCGDGSCKKQLEWICNIGGGDNVNYCATSGGVCD